MCARMPNSIRETAVKPRKTSMMEDGRGDLARLRLERAEEFASGAASREVASEPTAYGQAIAIELSLKSFLHGRGWSDERTRAELRHDLVRALDAAEAAGLAPDADLRRLAGTLNRWYALHDWHEFAGEPTEVLASGAAVVTRLLAQVRATIEGA